MDMFHDLYLFVGSETNNITYLTLKYYFFMGFFRKGSLQEKTTGKGQFYNKYNYTIEVYKIAFFLLSQMP